MSVKFQDQRRDASIIKPVNVSQRSSCIIVVYRYDQTDIAKLTRVNASNDRGVSGGGAADTTGNFSTRSRVVIKNDIVRCTVSKDKEGSSGTFSFTLKQGKQVKSGQIQKDKIDYIDALHPGDWVMIYMNKHGSDESIDINSTKPSSGLKFLGIIETVRYIELDEPSSAKPRLEYNITGRDWGKVFDNDIFFNPQFNQQTIQNLLGANFLTDSSKVLKGNDRASLNDFTPDKVMKNVISFYMGGKFDSLNVNNQTWYIPGELAQRFKPQEKIKSKGVSFVDILSLSKIGMHKFSKNKFTGVSALPGAALVKALPSSGSIWSVMHFLSNSAVNELFTDLTLDSKGNLVPSVIHRQMPFSNKPNHETNVFHASSRSPKDGGNGAKLSDKISDDQKTYFIDLPRHNIPSTEIKQKNIGKNDYERVNHVIVVPRVDSATYDIAFVAILNTPSIQRYGFKTVQAQTAYCLATTEGIKNYCERCTNLIADWFFLGHQLFNGSLLIDGVEEHVELGSNLYISDVQQLFHIEGYTHTFEVDAISGGRSYNTELRVSRGQNLINEKASFIGPSSRYKDPVTIASSILENNR
jgi:hypothetical protein